MPVGNLTASNLPDGIFCCKAMGAGPVHASPRAPEWNYFAGQIALEGKTIYASLLALKATQMPLTLAFRSEHV
jgi:hypothetical protein